MCISVSDFYMKIINNRHTLLYNFPTIHSIQQYYGLCELTIYVFKISKYINEKMCMYFHIFFKNSVGFVLSNCLNAKKIHTQCSIELSVHKQQSVFNITYTIQSRVNCPNIITIHIFLSIIPLTVLDLLFIALYSLHQL